MLIDHECQSKSKLDEYKLPQTACTVTGQQFNWPANNPFRRLIERTLGKYERGSTNTRENYVKKGEETETADNIARERAMPAGEQNTKGPKLNLESEAHKEVPPLEEMRPNPHTGYTSRPYIISLVNL